MDLIVLDAVLSAKKLCLLHASDPMMWISLAKLCRSDCQKHSLSSNRVTACDPAKADRCRDVAHLNNKRSDAAAAAAAAQQETSAVQNGIDAVQNRLFDSCSITASVHTALSDPSLTSGENLTAETVRHDLSRDILAAETSRDDCDKNSQQLDNTRYCLLTCLTKAQ